jgi:ribonuclease BN (tRNA processing enzyme)
VREGSTLVLLDFGPGALERVWERDLLGHVDAIVISHLHLDHALDLLPLSGEITEMAVRARRPHYSPPALYVPRGRGPEALRGLAEAVGSDPGRFERSFGRVREYDDSDAFAIGELRIAFAATAHTQPCYAARVRAPGATLVYGADGGWSDELVALAEGANLLLVEATLVDPEPGSGHMSGEEAGRLAAGAGAQHLVLTHLVPWPERNAENVARAAAVFDGEISLAREGAVFTT